MVVEQVIRIFKDEYLQEIQNTSIIALNQNYIRNADIDELYEIARCM